MESEKMNTIAWNYLGMVRYSEGLGLQRDFHGKFRSGAFGRSGFLLMLQHYPVITNGRFGSGDNFLLPKAEIEKRGVEVFSTERGGDVTFHGPGQLVAYPIIDLRAFNMGAKSYVCALEECIIRLLGGFGIDAARREGYPGVWAGEEKIASIGVAVKNGITMHGCAVNMNTDLDYFSLIVPCGIHGAGVTSVKNILGAETDIESAAESFALVFGDVFNINPERFADRECMTS